MIESDYQKFYQDLLAAGTEPVVAEAITSIHMSQDPNISKEMRQLIAPVPAGSGTGGTYFIHNLRGEKIGIFKPQDEEIFMPNNPRRWKRDYDSNNPLTMGPRAAHFQGTGWTKEISAYIIGQQMGVPLTVSMTVPFPTNREDATLVQKTGSFQIFASGVPASTLNLDQVIRFPKEQVQKIAALDLVLGNHDRTLANMLWDSLSQTLTPIDHGFILIDSQDPWVWQTWPQVLQEIAPPIKKWILSLDVTSLQKILKEKAHLSDRSIYELKARLLFVQAAMREGFTLEHLGRMTTPLGGKASLFDMMLRDSFLQLPSNQQNAEAHLLALPDYIAAAFQQLATVIKRGTKNLRGS